MLFRIFRVFDHLLLFLKFFCVRGFTCAVFAFAESVIFVFSVLSLTVVFGASRLKTTDISLEYVRICEGTEILTLVFRLSVENGK